MPFRQGRRADHAQEGERILNAAWEIKHKRAARAGADLKEKRGQVRRSAARRFPKSVSDSPNGTRFPNREEMTAKISWP